MAHLECERRRRVCFPGGKTLPPGSGPVPSPPMGQAWPLPRSCGLGETNAVGTVPGSASVTPAQRQSQGGWLGLGILFSPGKEGESVTG